ncbi:MAG: hypothetical protein V8S74_02545 [Lachnospirales bacterium]
MKIYKSEITVINKIDKIKCNCCGTEITADANGYSSDYLSVSKRWNYHSSFDNQEHNFDLCEDCYKKLISTFKIPVN